MPKNNLPPVFQPTVQLPQIRSAADLCGLQLRRNVTIKREAVNQDERTVDMAFCTETPVERWYGFEVLDCRPKSVRLNRLKSRAPILVDHNPSDQVGVIEPDSVTMDKDKTGRLRSRYSRSARASEVFQDVVDEIRTCTSVGYMVHEAVLESEKDGVPTYRILDWEPYEVSIVSMPADINCGVGRAFEPTTHPKEIRTMEKCKHCGLDLVNARCTCDGFIQDERAAVLAADNARRQAIIDEGEKFADKGGREMAMRLIRDPNATVDTFRTEMLDAINQRSRSIPPVAIQPMPQGQSFGAVPISTALRYNPASLRAFSKRFDKVRDQEEAAFRSGMWAKAILMNSREAQRWCADNGLQSRVMNELTGASGGFNVPDEMESAIVDMRLQYGVARRLCKVIPMGSAAVTVPVRTAGVTSYFVAEQGAPTANDPTWGQAQLVAKSLKTETRFTQELEEDAVIDIGAFVVDELALSQAAMEDNCWLNGDGTSTYGGMTGLITLLEAGYSTLAGCVAAASNTDTWSEIIASELTAVMGKCPSYAKGNAKWLASPYSDSMVFARLLAAGGGNTIQTLQGSTGAAYLGYMRETSEYMPAGATTDYTNKVMVLFGDFGKACLFGDRRGITVQVLRELYAQNGIISVLATSRFDINNQYAVGNTTAAGPVCALIGG